VEGFKMKKGLLFILLLVSGLLTQPMTASSFVTIIKMPEPHLNGNISLEQAIGNCQNVQDFTTQKLKIEQIGQLCWSGQGIADTNGHLRAVPSKMTAYPMQLSVVLPDGLYIYEPNGHGLIKFINSDIRPMLYVAAFKQQVVQDSPCIFIISGYVKKTEAQFRGRGERLICLEAGHIAQNIQLQAVVLGLSSTSIGEFDPKTVARICKFAADMEPLYLICVGNPVKKVSIVPVVSPVSPQVPAVGQPVDVRTKKVVIIVASRRFNDIDFFGAQQALQIADVQTGIAGLEIGEIKGLGLGRNTITSTMLIKDVKVDDYDAFVFIGSSGTATFYNDKDLLKLVRQANDKKKILAAIGTAPIIFAYADIVRGKNIASYIAHRAKLTQAGAEWKNSSLEIDGNLITAATASDSENSAAANRFGTAILQMLRQQDGQDN